MNPNTIAKPTASAKVSSTEDSFRRYAALGYSRLVPVIPPDAPIWGRSSLFGRIGTKQDARGKVPGVRRPDGTWCSFDWLSFEADDTDLGRWGGAGAGVGIKTGNGLLAIDADTLDSDHAKVIRDVVTDAIGRTPIRVGQHPKAIYLVRVDGPFPYQRVEFGPPIQSDGKVTGRQWRVEVPSDGKFFVAEGVHPKTGKPYSWPRELIPFAELPVVSPAVMTGIIERLRTVLPDTGALITEGATSTISQASLKGDLEMVRRAVEAIPNTSEHFPSRESYRDMGYAIKAALPDHQAEALALFEDWCSRWKDGDNDPGVVAADWSRMKPPYRRGASWLYEQAEQLSGGAFSVADVWLDDLELNPLPEPSPFAEQLSAPEALPPIEWVRPSQWAGKVPPEREWEVKNWILKGEVTLLYGDGGIGKTLLAQQYATAAAAGLPWLGQETRPAKVMCFLCEDSEGELHRRQEDINRSLGITMDQIDDRLRIAPRRFQDNMMVLWDRNTGAMKRQPVWGQLRDDALAFGADVVILDTIADTYSGSEIDRAQVSAFVNSCLGRLGHEIGGTVIALGHPSAAGKSSGTGTSGSTAWSNAARGRLYLRHPKGVSRGNVRELEGMKINYGETGNVLKLRWDRGAFVALASSAPPSTSAASSSGLVTVPSVEAAACDALIAALRACGDQRMSLKPNSQYHFLKVLRRREADLLQAFNDTELQQAMATLEKAKAVVPCEVGRDDCRRAIMGFAVVADVVSPAPDPEGGIFE